MDKYESAEYSEGTLSAACHPEPSIRANALPATLSSRQRRRRLELRHDPTLKPRERDRVEALLLSVDGMRVPRLARHFACCEATVRRGLHQCAGEGLKSLRYQRRGLGPDVARRQAVRRALNGLLSRKRTGTAAPLAEALADKGLVMKPRTVRQSLKRMGARYRRTTDSVRPQQDPARVAQARTERDDLNKKPTPGTWIFSSSTQPASPSPSPPPLPGVAAGRAPSSPTNTARASA